MNDPPVIQLPSAVAGDGVAPPAPALPPGVAAAPTAAPTGLLQLVVQHDASRDVWQVRLVQGHRLLQAMLPGSAGRVLSLLVHSRSTTPRLRGTLPKRCVDQQGLLKQTAAYCLEVVQFLNVTVEAPVPPPPCTRPAPSTGCAACCRRPCAGSCAERALNPV